MSNNSLENAMIPLMPIWDTINELDRLRGLASLMATLTGPLNLKEGHPYEAFHDYFADVSDRLDAAVIALNEAREKIKFV